VEEGEEEERKTEAIKWADKRRNRATSHYYILDIP
jgi:hypothetical protein